MARLQLLGKRGDKATQISNYFIENYMPKSNPMFSSIYIFTYKRLTCDGRAVDTKELASVFGILESDVINAWKYWESEGLVAIEDDGAGLMGISFLDIPEKEPAENKKTDSDEKPARKRKLKSDVSLESRTDYSVQELEYYQNQCDEIRGLFSFAEDSLGRTLKYNDLNLLYSLHDWLRLPVPVIEKLVSYCAENGHRNMAYIEAVAINWRENGVDSIEGADAYIQMFNVNYRSVLKAFGQNRNPAHKEIEYMDRWLGELAMPLDIVLEACDKTIIACGKPNFKYADTIITNWSKEGVKTLDDILNAETAFAAQKTTRPATRRKRPFDNFEGRKIDYEKLEQMETEYIDGMVNSGGSVE